jgi:hypothetical protein
MRIAACECESVADRVEDLNVFLAVNSQLSLPCRRHRAQQPFSKGVLSAACRIFGAVPLCCDPIRAAAQLGSGRIHRLSHWTTPP